MKYVKEFATHAAYENYMSDNPVLPNVSYCDDEINDAHFNPYVVHALKFTATGTSTLGMTNEGSNAPALEYSNDGINWSTWDYNTLNIANGQSVYIRGTNPDGISRSTTKYSYFTMTGSLACSGNVMWLIDYNTDLTTIPCNYCFYYLFRQCTSLISAPELSATTLAEGCYSDMFQSCTALTAAPALPATTLASSCYSAMFRGCSNLSSITMLATNISASNALTNWVSGVAASGTFKKKADVSIPSGISGIPSGWTVVEV